MKTLETIIFTSLTIAVMGLLFGFIKPLSVISLGDSTDSSGLLPVRAAAYDTDAKISEILGASGGRFRVFNLQNQVIRIDTATSHIAILEAKENAWMNLQLSEKTLTGFEAKAAIHFLESMDF